MHHHNSQQRGPHASRAHWPAVLFAVVAIAAMVVILAADAQRTGNGETRDTGGSTTQVEYLCEQGEPEGFELDDIEGKSIAEAEEFAASIDQSFRTVVIDGEHQVVTLDFRDDRMNVQVDDGTVTRYCGNY